MKTLSFAILLGFALRADASTTCLWFDSQDTRLGVTTRSYDLSNATFTPFKEVGTSSYLYGYGENFRFEVTNSSDRFDYWVLDFGSAPSRPASILGVGLYQNAMRSGGAFNPVPRIDFYGSGRGNNATIGWFVILEIEKDINGEITKLAVDFSQRGQDYNGNPVGGEILGSLRFNSSFAPIPEPTVIFSLPLALLAGAMRRRK